MKPFLSVVAVATAILSGAAAVAQQLDASNPAFPTTDFEHLQVGKGKVERFTMTPTGRLDGFLLEGGAQVHFPPHLSEQLGATVRAGDTVSIEGYRTPAAPVIIASSVTDVVSHKTVADQGPDVAETPPPLTGPPIAGAQPTAITDKVDKTLYDPEGGVEGAVLADGALLRLEPQTTNRAETLLTPGQSVTVQGWKVNTPFGSVLAAERVTSAASLRK
jgi:hypothetical protein